MDKPAPSQTQPSRARSRRVRRPTRWWLVVFRCLAIPYLVVCGIVAACQRTLLYPATRMSVLNVWQSGTEDTRDVRTSTDDGLELNGWWFTSADESVISGERRVILYLPGNGGCRLDRAEICRRLAMLPACDVVIFDYRGYGDNPGSPTESGLHKDALASWKYLRQQGWQPGQIILFGESLGGAVATHLAKAVGKDGEDPAALVVRSTFSSMTDTASRHYPFLPVRWLLLDRYESVRAIAEVTCPIVILHGDQDTIVPIELGEKLFRAAPQQSAAGIEKRFVCVAGTDHNDFPNDPIIAAIRSLLPKVTAERQVE